MKEIKITCEAKELINIDKIESIQGELKSISSESMDKLKKSIIKHGFSFPVFVWKNKDKYYSIDGVHRVKALKELRDIDNYSIPVAVPVAHISAKNRAEAKTLLLAVSSQYAKFSLDGMTDFIKDLNIDDIIDEIFIPDIDIDSVLNIPQETEGDDEVPDEVEPVTKLGDLWELGRHRVLCGDSTDAETVGLLMNGQKADMVFTSPPYNANSKMANGGVFEHKSVNMYIKNKDNLSSTDYVDFAKKVLEMCFLVTDGFIFWNVSYNAKSRNEYIKQIYDKLDFLIEQICWKKSSTIPFKGCLKREWEPIYVFSTNKQGLKVKEITGNFWKISNQNIQSKDHKACFPVELPQKAIMLVQENSGIVLDLFLGSGTTLISCEKTNRVCYGMELDPHYCDVIVTRYKTWCENNNIVPEIKLNGVEYKSVL